MIERPDLKQVALALVIAVAISQPLVAQEVGPAKGSLVIVGGALRGVRPVLLGPRTVSGSWSHQPHGSPHKRP
jgi:hypothetical protein